MADLAFLNCSAEDIRIALLNNHGIEVTRRSINKRLREWDARPPAFSSKDIEQRVYNLHCQYLTTQEVLQILDHEQTLGQKLDCFSREFND